VLLLKTRKMTVTVFYDSYILINCLKLLGNSDNCQLSTVMRGQGVYYKNTVITNVTKILSKKEHDS
jgi:hypothetical protein